MGVNRISSWIITTSMSGCRLSEIIRRHLRSFVSMPWEEQEKIRNRNTEIMDKVGRKMKTDWWEPAARQRIAAIDAWDMAASIGAAIQRTTAPLSRARTLRCYMHHPA